MRSRYVPLILAIVCLHIAGGFAFGVILEDQVVVVYNSQDTDSQAVFDHYVSVHPNVQGVDLNTTFSSPHTLSYTEFVAKVRDPIRSYLQTSNPTGSNIADQVSVLTLTKGIPHRIADINSLGVGDTPGSAADLFEAGNATYASVDSELTLLWQGLDTGESNGLMDSHADNVVANPYHGQAASFNSFDRTAIQSPRTFTSLSDDMGQPLAWQMHDGASSSVVTDAGSMYLTTRLDGRTVADVTAMIDRAQNPSYNPVTDQIILDESPPPASPTDELDDTSLFSKATDPSYAGNDYDEAFIALSGQWANLILDKSSSFLIGTNGSVVDPDAVAVTGPVAVLASFGGNHSVNDQAGYLATFEGQLVDGAILNTLESFNAKDLGGAGGFGDQGQLAQWIASGGTFGVGNIFEPFAFSVSDNELLLEQFLLGGLTWAEAAWASIPYLSWQQVVLGDPLARAALVPEPAVSIALLIGILIVSLVRKKR